ncbi:MAG: (d)CMP kinase [Coriobacteriales bacterium]|nr:(d)CMP kinase [Coriobacteriales bacterium]
MIIAIDGPAGSGKSTVAKLAARDLGFAYLDTGAMYRAVAWRALEEGIGLEDEQACEQIALNECIVFGYSDGDPLPSTVSIGGRDATLAIRTPTIDRAVTPVSALAAVRSALVSQQRIIGRERDTVMEGRDIGTVVFPDAELKIFLTATPEARALRRVKQNCERHQAALAKTGISEIAPEAMDYGFILTDIQRRDAADSSREVAPLKPADDSITIDTTDMTIAEVVSCIVKLVHDKSFS